MAYNGHFAKNCFHPLFGFTSEGDCLGAKLRPGNVHSADGALQSDRSHPPSNVQQLVHTLQTSLPPATMLQAPTIFLQGQIVEQSSGQTDGEDGLVVPFREKGSREPLFFVHDGWGGIMFVRDLAKAHNVELKSMAVMNEDSVGSRSCSLGATQAALEDQFKVAAVIEYPYDIADATTLVEEIHKSGADFVVHSPYFNDAIVFGKAFKESGLWPMFIAGGNASGYVDPESIKALGDAAEGISNTYSYNPAKNTPQNKKFVDAFKQIKGYIPTEPAGMNYYGAMTLYEALEYSGKNFPDDPLNPDNLRAICSVVVPESRMTWSPSWMHWAASSPITVLTRLDSLRRSVKGGAVSPSKRETAPPWTR